MKTHTKHKLVLSAEAVLLGALLPAAVSAQAQSTDASRYVNSQGIEVIQARQPLSVRDDRIAQAAKSDNAVREQPAPAPRTTQQAMDGRFQVSAAEQAERDLDRLAILQQELMSEAAAFQTKWKTLHTPSMKASLSDEEVARVRETMHNHESNLRALNAEISRVQAETDREQRRTQ